ncbi:hypothetical protein Psyaliredsea_25280 [Psychrobacter alimentarius]
MDKIMSVDLYLDLVNYERRDVYQEVLVAHIENIRCVLKDCEALKKYDTNSTKAISIDIEKPIKKIEESLFKSVFTKLSIKNNKLNLESVKEGIDECNEVDVHEGLTSKLWSLFALSVCNDHLLLLLNRGELTVAEYRSFLQI